MSIKEHLGNFNPDLVFLQKNMSKKEDGAGGAMGAMNSSLEIPG